MSTDASSQKPTFSLSQFAYNSQRSIASSPAASQRRSVASEAEDGFTPRSREAHFYRERESDRLGPDLLGAGAVEEAATPPTPPGEPAAAVALPLADESSDDDVPLALTQDAKRVREERRTPDTAAEETVRTMFSADEIADEGGGGGLPVCVEDLPVEIEVLNTIQASGMPPHKLDLKLGMTVVLLRDINPDHREGTRYVLTGISRFCLEMRKNGTGETILVPRFMFVTDTEQFGFVLRRRQFPIRPAAAAETEETEAAAAASPPAVAPADAAAYPEARTSTCFKCRTVGHWARDCSGPAPPPPESAQDRAERNRRAALERLEARWRARNLG